MKIFRPLFILLVSFQVCSCQKQDDAGVQNLIIEDERVADLEEELDHFREQLADEKKLRLRQSGEQAALVAKLTGLVETLSETQTAIPSEPEVKVSLVAAVKKEDEADVESRRLSRLQAQGEELAELVTNSGERYENLVITRVTDIGVVFRHKGGIARVPFTDLPAAWLERFYYDEDRALLSLKHERLAQARYNRDADARIEEMNAKKAAEEVDALTLEKIAQVVEQVQQPAVTTTIVEDRIRVYPPLIVGRNYYSNGGFFHPPVVRTPVVRTPTGVIPTIRPSSLPSVIRPSSKPAVRPTPVKPSIQRPTLRPSSSRPVKPSIQRPTSRPTITRPTRPSIQRRVPSRPSAPVVRPGRVRK